jgi:transcription elongation GreA/GreB family factor
VDKVALRDALRAELQTALDRAEIAHAAAIEGATHAESRAENPKDTRGLEQSYLARGQAQRVAELASAIATIDALALRRFGPNAPVAMSALVTLDDGQRCFIAPAGGGTVLAGGVAVVTPSSPLGAALIGRSAGDEIDFRGREIEITAVE